MPSYDEGIIEFSMTQKKSVSSTDVIIIKTSPGNKIANSEGSQQVDQVWWSISGIIPIAKWQNFADMFYLYEESFIIGGIIDRIVTIASSEWKFPEGMNQDAIDVINSIDKEYALRSLLVTGNIFLEKVRNNAGWIASLERFITTEVRISKIPGEDGKTTIEYRQAADGVINQNPFKKENVVHIKLTSNQSRYYGDSKIYKARQQIILLGLIDKFYSNMFSKWMLKTSILADKSGKLTVPQLQAIKTQLEDLTKWIDNSFATIILPGDITNIWSFDKEQSAEEFLKYRDALIESIAIALNIPVDILVPAKASRNTKAESLEELNRDIVTPLQQKFVEQLKKQLKWEVDGIDDLMLEPVDTKNQKNDMDIWTGYKKSWIITANEVREKLWMDHHDGGDELTMQKSDTPANPTDTQITKIEEEIKKMYAK